MKQERNKTQALYAGLILIMLAFVSVLVRAQVTIQGSTVVTGAGGGGGSTGLYTYSTPGTVAGGRCQVSAYTIVSDLTAAFNACTTSQLPAAGGVIDATGLGAMNYTVTTPLTALNSSKPVVLILQAGTTITFNTSFASPTNSPSSCAVPVGNNSAIVVLGSVPLNSNFILGSSARVWDFVCNGNFTGSQFSARLDGVQIQGNSAASVSGALLHLQGVSYQSRVSNSSTQSCYAQCVELDAGTTSPKLLARMLLDGDHFTDGATTGSYPGSVVKIDAISSTGGIGNIVFEGGGIDFNGPHNPLLVINGRGSDQLNSVAFFDTQFNTAPATASSYNANVDPIQLTDAAQIFFSNLHVTGNTTPASQVNLVDISQTETNLSYGIEIYQVQAFTAAGFTCLINNTIEGTCEAGYAQGGSGGDTALPNYTYGQIVPQIRQTNVAAPSSCNIAGNVWTNSADTTSGAFKVCFGTPGSQTYQTVGGGGGGGGGSFSAITSGTNTTAAMLCGTGCTLSTAGSGSISATTPVNTPTVCSSGEAATGVGANFAAVGCTTYLQGSLTATYVPVASGSSALGNSSITDNGTVVTITDPSGLQITGTTPGKVALAAGTGSMPALPSNSAGFAAPVSGGTSYLFKLPATISQGFLLAGTPATGDGVNESAVTTQHLEFPLSTGWAAFGTEGANNSLTSYTALNAGHVVKLTIAYGGGATCTTGPTVGIYDNTTLGFTVTGSTTYQPIGTVTPATGSMAFSAGDVITLGIEAQGNCAGDYNATATVSEP